MFYHKTLCISSNHDVFFAPTTRSISVDRFGLEKRLGKSSYFFDLRSGSSSFGRLSEGVTPVSHGSLLFSLLCSVHGKSCVKQAGGTEGRTNHIHQSKLVDFLR